MTFRTNRIALGTLAFLLLFGTIGACAESADAASSASTAPAVATDSTAAASAASATTAPASSAPVKPSGHASKTPVWTRVHRVDDFVTDADRRAGVILSDSDAPIVVFSHGAHTSAGVTCEQCHHTGVKGWEAPACATCHKGKAAVEVMHEACITCHESRGKGPVTCNACHTARQTSVAGIVRFQLFDLLRGPLFIAAWVIFALGFAWRIFQFTRMTRRVGAAPPMPRPVQTAEDTSFLMKGRSGIGRVLFRIRRWVKSTVFGRNPVMGVVSLVFHLLLVAAPFFLPAHALLFRESFHWNLPTLPEQLVDELTLALLAIGVFFLVRRLVLPRVRALTTVRDYLVLLLVAAPFVTAYMAYHQWLDYRTVLATHMMVGEIVIAAIPFTKLGHMPFLLFSRFFASGEYSWKPGNRRW